MIGRKISVILAVCAVILVSAPLAWGAGEGTGSYDMEAAVKRALAAYPSVAAAQAAADAAARGVSAAEADRWPSLNLGYAYTHYDDEYPSQAARRYHSDVFSGSLNVHQPLYTGDRLEASLESAKLSKDQAETGIDSTELGLIETVQANFLTLLKARENVRSAKDSVARLESQLKVTKAFHDVGLKPRLDVLQAEVQLATAENSLLQATNALDTQEARMNTLLALPLDKKVSYMGQLAFAPCSLSLDNSLQRAYADRPDLKSAAQDVEIARQDARVAKSALYPQLGADFDWSSSGEKPTLNGGSFGDTGYSSWNVGASVSWTAFDWGSNRETWKQAEDAVRAAEHTLSARRLEVQYEVKSKFLAMRNASDRIKVARKSLEAAKESYRMAVARYQAQVGTNTDVLDAQADLSSSEAALTESLADYQIALSALYAAIGERNMGLIAR